MTDNEITNVSNTNMLATLGDRENLAMALMFDDALFQRTRTIANMMANAKGITPPHLIGKPETCYAVVTRSIIWNLEPMAVAGSTYDVHGNFGYYGKLCRAILEKSGRFEDRLKYKKIGDWSKVAGKFSKQKGKSGSEYPVATYTEKDEEGLGVEITYKIKGEDEATFEFYLNQAYPRNSTLWATDPWTQLCYLATRRFSSLEVPDIFMGVPFDKENIDNDAILDVTPAKRRSNSKAGRKTNAIDEVLEDKAKVEEDVEPAETVQETEGVDEPVEENKAEPSTPEQTSLELTPAQIKADEIIQKLITAKNREEKEKIYNDNATHIFSLPKDLADSVQQVYEQK